VDISPREQATTRRQHRSFLAMLFRRGWLPPVALLCLLGMIAYVLKVEIWDRLRPQRPAVAAEFSLPHTNREIIATYERACADLARRGVPRRPADTPSEHLDHATAGFADAPDVVDALGGLTRAVVRFRYSNAVATDTDVTSASEAGLALRAALRKVPRRRPAAADPVPSGA
jgi:hypothetical protein